jgi:hypothetical protein
MIPLGDLDLRHEITGAVVNMIRYRRGCTKRIYSARVAGRNSNMTVVFYQGQAAEEVCMPRPPLSIHYIHLIIQVWRHELGRYVMFRCGKSPAFRRLLGFDFDPAIRIWSRFMLRRPQVIYTPRFSMTVDAFFR